MLVRVPSSQARPAVAALSNAAGTWAMQRTLEKVEDADWVRRKPKPEPLR